jgi:hypothetical protein
MAMRESGPGREVNEASGINRRRRVDAIAAAMGRAGNAGGQSTDLSGRHQADHERWHCSINWLRFLSGRARATDGFSLG